MEAIEEKYIEVNGINRIDENVYVILPGNSSYSRITKEIYDNIQKGKYEY